MDYQIVKEWVQAQNKKAVLDFNISGKSIKYSPNPNRSEKNFNYKKHEKYEK